VSLASLRSNKQIRMAVVEAAVTALTIAGSIYLAKLRNLSGAGNSSQSLFSECIVGGGANAFTSALLNPLDIVKTRMQVEVMKRGERGTALHSGLRRSILLIYRQHGLAGLYTPGLTATMIREMFNCSARTGLYAPVRNLIAKNSEGGEATLSTRITSAFATGTLGSIVSNPVDVVKVRLLNNPALYPSTFAAYPALLREEGGLGALRGVVPSTLRGAFLAVGELATYDQVKHEIKTRLGLKEGVGIHVSASLITGVVATSLAAPFDLVKTRVMADQSASSSLGLLATAVKNEGPQVLMRGWVPSYMRLGPHALICLPVFEQMRLFVGVGYL